MHLLTDSLPEVFNSQLHLIDSNPTWKLNTCRLCWFTCFIIALVDQPFFIDTSLKGGGGIILPYQHFNSNAIIDHTKVAVDLVP